jgi:hypothetical protein
MQKAKNPQVTRPHILCRQHTVVIISYNDCLSAATEGVIEHRPGKSRRRLSLRLAIFLGLVCLALGCLSREVDAAL